jgi:signal transduction histidine kinase
MSMATTILTVGSPSPGREALARALAEAGLAVTQVVDWDEARDRMADCETALVVCDGEVDARALARAVSPKARDLPHDALHALSHDLRTPLSAMVGWVHLMETGRLDEAGVKRAIEKLKGNIEEQVRTLDRYLGTLTKEGRP